MNKQNSNVIDYDYIIESNHDYNHVELSSEWKKTDLHGLI